MSETQVFSAEQNLSAARGTEWNELGVGTTGGATATKAATAGARHKITDIHGHSDGDCTVQIKNGSTVIWEIALDVDVEGYKFGYSFNTPKIGSVGNAMSAVISASSADCAVAFGGFSTVNR